MMNLRIPGPTPLPPDVLLAVGQQMINHRGADFERLFGEVSAWLKLFFETEQEVYVLTSSGTGAMEASIANTLSPGDRVLAVSCGSFGDRFDEIARAYRADVTSLKAELGRAAEPEVIARAVRQQGPFQAVILTHNETSTGVLNDVQAIAAAIRAAADPAPLIMVDSISGLGGVRLQMDAWGVDAVITGSQKAWMAPPGLAMIALSQRAWRAYETAQNPRYYFDLGLAKSYLARNQTPSTPALPALYGLHTSLRRMVEEGVEAVAARHEALAAHCRQRALALGLGLYAQEGRYSPTVTALILPEGIKPSDVLKTLVAKYDIHAGSTKDPRVGVIRIGHMGYCSLADLDAVFAALAEILSGEISAAAR
jgi:aspartate aminotransferase-like enzyme